LGRASGLTSAALAEAEAAQRTPEQTILSALRETSDAVAGVRPVTGAPPQLPTRRHDGRAGELRGRRYDDVDGQ
jgi:hypothetical protein